MSVMLLPDRKFPLRGGVPVLVSQVEFLGCCCDMCQWRVNWEWSCGEDAWVQVGESEWIPAERDPGESEELCTRTVWGEIVTCPTDPRPAEPPAPALLTVEDLEECCPPPAPCTCPEGLLEQYLLTSWARKLTFYDDLGCTGTVNSVQDLRIAPSDMPLTLTGFPGSCYWTALANVEESVDGGSWSDLGSRTIVLNLDADECRWALVEDVDAYKATGLTPVGNYAHAFCNDEVASSIFEEVSGVIE